MRTQTIANVAGLATLLACQACSDPASPAGSGPAVGAVRVTVATIGDDLDSDGYVITVGDRTLDVASTSNTVLRDVPPGDHTLIVSGAAGNCTVSGTNPKTIRVLERDTVVVPVDVRCEWAGAERIIAFLDGSIASMTVHASGIRVLQSIPQNFFAAISPNGERIAFTSNRDGNSEIYVMSSDGSNVVNLTRSPSAQDWWPRWSPDGSRILFYSWEAADPRTGEIYVIDADGSGPSLRLTANDALDADPEWSPDGSKIVFMSERDGNQEIYVMNADGTQPTRLTQDSGLDGTPAWSPDGNRIAFASTRFSFPAESYDIMLMNADGSNVSRLTNDPEIDVRPVWSPDGSRLLYSHRVAQGNYDIWIMNADATGKSMLVGGAGNQQAEAWGRLR